MGRLCLFSGASFKREARTLHLPHVVCEADTAGCLVGILDMKPHARDSLPDVHFAVVDTAMKAQRPSRGDGLRAELVRMLFLFPVTIVSD